MKSLLSLLAILFYSTSFSQVISYEDFKGIIPELQAENWKSAFKASEKLLNDRQNDSSDLRAIITYINIFSAAGMVTQDQMSHEAFLKQANKFIGQRVMMAAHPISSDERNTLNKTFLSKGESGSKGFTTACNSKATYIFCFENFQFEEDINPSDFQGANVRCGGILKAIEINPNKSKIWISRLHIENATIRRIN